MKLFDDIERNDKKPSSYSESLYSFLNRTGRVEYLSIRNVLEEWFSHYPESEKADLCARFCSDNNSQHQAAFFELFLHEMLLRMGCQVTLHPKISNMAKSPDFLVTSPKGESFYVEATIATNNSDAKTTFNARINTLYDVLNQRVDSPNFFLGINIKGTSTTSPPARKIASFINQHLKQLDYDQITKLYSSGRIKEVPRWYFEHDGLKIEFQPIPKKSEVRGKPGLRPIGLLHTEVQYDNLVFLKSAITRKAGRYGNLDLPFIVAVNVLEFMDRNDIIEALFGKMQLNVVFPKNWPDEPIDTIITLIPDGVWTKTDGPRYTRLSAVLLATQLYVNNITRATLRLYHNPWAKRPYQSVLTRLSQAVIKDKQLEYIEGESTSLIFGLPVSWPNEGI